MSWPNLEQMYPGSELDQILDTGMFCVSGYALFGWFCILYQFCFLCCISVGVSLVPDSVKVLDILHLYLFYYQSA